MNKKQGFTLIELLVVVLIIGILAAVALPQYTKAVEKARAAEAISLVRVIRDAQSAYYMANGEYAADLNDLDISIQGADGFSGVPRKETKLFSFAGHKEVDEVSGTVIALGNRLPLNTYYVIFATTDESRLLCKYYTTKGEELCKSFGGQKKAGPAYYIN